VKKRIQAFYLADNSSINQLDKNMISALNWPAFPYQPAVSFSIAYQEDNIFLKYYVSEKDIKAKYTNTNDPVYKDTCVEFFIGIGADPKYYNFEFNCIGTCLAAYGADRNDRVFLSKPLIEEIKHLSSFKQSNGLIHWELNLTIPRKVFCYHDIVSFKGLTGKANFYKCGDDLPVPHFLSWNLVETEEPDFHQSGFFGDIEFVTNKTGDNIN
jgi:hypothetical protein